LKRLRVDNSDDLQEPWKTDPYRDGAVALTTLRSGGGEPLSLTVFCRKGSVPAPFLLLSKRIFDGAPGWAPGSISADELKKSVFAWLINFDRTGQRDLRDAADIASVSIAKDGMAHMTIKLGPNDIARFTRSKVVSVQVDQPRVYGYPFSGDFALQGASAHIELAMRNCVGSN
jgi:hypothetical protein